MKRIRMKTTDLYKNLKVDMGVLPRELDSLTENLQLLYDVPLNYLVPEPAYLPPESIRFFYLDTNYIKAMLNGATAIGRSTNTECLVDRVILPKLEAHSNAGSVHVRKSRVHINHHQMLLKASPGHSRFRTGFLLRSSLVRRRKGIVVCAFRDKEQLAALRLETLTPDIMIGIFDGELTKLTIAEPSCGLRFGCRRDFNNPVISLKEIGVPVEDKTFQLKVNNQSRVDVLAAAGRISEVLKQCGEIKEDISSGIFAYQILQAAQKAELHRKEE